jgi:sucrose synthase
MAAFAMPGLFRAVDAVSVFDPRFNISSPGADADIYFPYTATDKRLTSLHASLHALVYGPADPDKKASRGYLEEGSGAPLLFSMARLDRVKNLAGLATWFADSPRLQAVCSLLIVGGTVDASASGSDPEAAEEAAALHALFDSGRLPPGKARWVPQQTNPVRNGELYRLVADGRGAFCLPSLFENFGLTVIEAAASGLPVFVTCHGGPAEIVHDGVEGLHINPYHGSAAADKMAGFFEAAEKDGGKTWEKTSQAALARVASRYNWGTYAARLVTMSRVYSFWRAATRLDAASAARTRYLELIYQLILRPLMARVKPGEDGSGGEGEGGGGTAEPPPSESCRGVCAVALGALADPGRVAPPSGLPSPASGGGGGGGGGVSRRPSSGRAVAGGGSGSGSADGGGGGGGKKG